MYDTRSSLHSAPSGMQSSQTVSNSLPRAQQCIAAGLSWRVCFSIDGINTLHKRARQTDKRITRTEQKGQTNKQRHICLNFSSFVDEETESVRWRGHNMYQRSMWASSISSLVSLEHGHRVMFHCASAHTRTLNFARTLPLACRTSSIHPKLKVCATFNSRRMPGSTENSVRPKPWETVVPTQM